MILKNKATQSSSQSINNTQVHCSHHRPISASVRPATQIERVLLALLYQGSLNCQEAEKMPIKARHLNSVISELANYHGLEIDREREVATGYQGEVCHLIRYKLHPHQIEKAQLLVDRWRIKRHAQSINWPALTSIALERLLNHK